MFGRNMGEMKAVCGILNGRQRRKETRRARPACSKSAVNHNKEKRLRKEKSRKSEMPQILLILRRNRQHFQI